MSGCTHMTGVEGGNTKVGRRTHTGEREDKGANKRTIETSRLIDKPEGTYSKPSNNHLSENKPGERFQVAQLRKVRWFWSFNPESLSVPDTKLMGLWYPRWILASAVPCRVSTLIRALKSRGQVPCARQKTTNDDLRCRLGAWNVEEKFTRTTALFIPRGTSRSRENPGGKIILGTSPRGEPVARLVEDDEESEREKMEVARGRGKRRVSFRGLSVDSSVSLDRV
ncbi:hypothetical protein KM043_013633 [Ampulex compressa]|nr:hypothetical protein KM043_013633 [Ampulex compressa]